MDPDTSVSTISEVTNNTAPLIDEMRFSSVKSPGYDVATLKWDVSANPGSKEVIAYIEDHAPDGRILHIKSNGDVVFHELVDKNFINYINLNTYQFYLDSSGNYIDNSLTDYEISLLCYFEGLINSECSTKYYIDEKNIENIISYSYFSNIDNIKLSSGINTSNVTDMRSMFEDSVATTIDVSNFDFLLVTNADNMLNVNSRATTDVYVKDSAMQIWLEANANPYYVSFIIK